MPKYIDPSKIRLTAVGTVDEDGDILVSVRDVKKAIDQTPAADVVPRTELEKIFAEIETCLATITTPLIRGDGTISAVRLNELCIRFEDYETIKRKYTRGAQVRECVKITLNP